MDAIFEKPASIYDSNHFTLTIIEARDSHPGVCRELTLTDKNCLATAEEISVEKTKACVQHSSEQHSGLVLTALLPCDRVPSPFHASTNMVQTTVPSICSLTERNQDTSCCSNIEQNSAFNCMSSFCFNNRGDYRLRGTQRISLASN